MDAQFWHARWKANEIGFHKPTVHPKLVDHLPALGLAPGARVFVPLCGKTLDIGWLLSQGFRVAGAELSEIAIRELFAGLGAEPQITEAGALKHFNAPGVDIFVGDIFQLNSQMLGPVDAVYDRAAVVAMPAAMRSRYVAHTATITNQSPQLVITFDYDQAVMDGPPFSVPADAVRDLYAETFTVTHLNETPVEGRLKGIAEAQEITWHMTPQTA